MAKITLSSILSGFASLTKLNSNFQAIASALNDRVLYRFNPSGEPNHMENNLDMNGYYILNQGNPVTVDGFNWKGAWVTSTSYVVGDIVEFNSSAYICVVTHTSGVFADDLAAIKWQLVAQASLPNQTGHATKFLQTNGSSASWEVPDAIEVSNTPAGNISATTTQGAINELDAEKWGLVESQRLTTLAVSDTGTADALAVLPSPAWTAYAANAAALVKKGGSANATTTPTLNVNSLGAKKLFDEAGTALEIGALKASMQFLAVYDTALDGGSGGFRCIGVRSLSNTAEIKSLTASVASNALTIQVPAGSIQFRNATLGNGTPNTRSHGALSLTISSGSTLGTTNAVASRIAVLEIDNSGTVELAAVNLSGGKNLDETTLISTTAEGGAGGADSANVIYSTTARSNVPFRVVGYVESTQATAGTWATAPSTVQGVGGQALSALQSLGYGQTWQDVTGSRSAGTTYYNTTGRPIAVSVISTSATGSMSVTVNGLLIAYCAATSGNSCAEVIIPPGASYSVTFVTQALSAWKELR